MGKAGGGIAHRIRELRQRCGGMTQQELAGRTGVTRQTVNAIEGNQYSPSLEVAFRIVRGLGANFEEVFQYDPPDFR